MSVMYGGAPGGAGYQPAGRVNFGWIGESFELFKLNAGVWVLAVLAYFFVPAIIGFIIGAAFGAANAVAGSAARPGGSLLNNGLPIGLNLLIQGISLVYRAFISGGLYHMAVKQVRGEPISAADLFGGGRYFVPMLVFSILYGLAVFTGFLLLIVPGLLVVSLMIPAYAMIGDGVGFSEAISRSIDGMKRDMWNGVAFMFVMGLILLVSAIPCGLGLFVTYPMFWLVSALAYRDMVGMPSLGQAAPGYGAPAPGVLAPRARRMASASAVAVPALAAVSISAAAGRAAASAIAVRRLAGWPGRQFRADAAGSRSAVGEPPPSDAGKIGIGLRLHPCGCGCDADRALLAGSDCRNCGRRAAVPGRHDGGRRPRQRPKIREKAGGHQCPHRHLPGSGGHCGGGHRLRPAVPAAVPRLLRHLPRDCLPRCIASVAQGAAGSAAGLRPFKHDFC